MNSWNGRGGARPGLAGCAIDGRLAIAADLEDSLDRLRSLGSSVGSTDSHDRRTGELKEIIGEARRALVLSASLEGVEVQSGVVGRASRRPLRSATGAVTPSEWLLRSVAHDLNNMLLVIQNCSQSLGQQSTSSAKREAGVVQDAVTQATRLVAKLLPSEPVIGGGGGVDVSECVRRFAGVIGSLVGERVEVVTELDPELPLARSDETAIFRVLSNLAANARDAMPAGGTLTLETRVVASPPERTLAAVADGYVLLAVRDTGEGMDSATSDRAFEPFFTTKQPGKGTGVGLTAVREIVQSVGGFVQMASEPSRGTTVSVYLECVRAPA
jgi:nitrogen-specific signal transduction histidine kinase